jgi:transaldolase
MPTIAGNFLPGFLTAGSFYIIEKPMKTNPLIQLEKSGQSVWLDSISRNLIKSGDLRKMIENDGLSGISSNPAIFHKAISGSHDYDIEIRILAMAGKDPRSIYEAISIKDLQMAADEFLPLYKSTDGKDGYVSMEVDPNLAYNTNATILEARRLWIALDRPNVLIKVPATKEGLPAIQQLISEGINVNITLLFGLPRYRQVAEAYIAGLRKLDEKGKPLNKVFSVASFFISRIASVVDPIEEQFLASHGEQAHFGTNIKGHVAISSAQIAYRMYKEIFGSEQFGKLAAKGARPQKLLWASTGTKNPEYSDVKYIEALIGENTINTMPPHTMNAYRDHGKPEARIELNIAQAEWVMDELPELGINIDKITQQLESEGVDKFIKQYELIIESIRKVLENK